MCKGITDLNVSSFDTRNVTDMGWMFSSCESLMALDVSSFDTRNVTDMGGMFHGCKRVQSLDISNFNTTKVTNMGMMFSGCEGLKKMNLNGIDTSNVTYMGSLFEFCENIMSLDLSSFNTSKITYVNMKGMFNGCSNLSSIITPINTDTEKGELPQIAGTQWKDSSGKVYTLLPGNIDHSIVLTRTQISNGNIGDNNVDGGDPDKGNTSGNNTNHWHGNTVTGCNLSPSVETVRGITISGISHQIAAGKKIRLNLNSIPENATIPKVKWSSSNTKIATVDSKGLVSIKKKTGGKTVKIIAEAMDGSGKKAVYSIRSMKGIVKKIAITGKSTVKPGKTLSLKAKVTASKGANKKVKWISSNEKYATVNASGKVKAAKSAKGKTVKITAMATDGSGKKKTIKIKIK